MIIGEIGCRRDDVFDFLQLVNVTRGGIEGYDNPAGSGEIFCKLENTLVDCRVEAQRVNLHAVGDLRKGHWERW